MKPWSPGFDTREGGTHIEGVSGIFGEGVTSLNAQLMFAWWKIGCQKEYLLQFWACFWYVQRPLPTHVPASYQVVETKITEDRLHRLHSQTVDRGLRRASYRAVCRSGRMFGLLLLSPGCHYR